MKQISLFCVFAIAVTTVTCVPVTQKSTSDTEVVIVPLEAEHPDMFNLDDGIVDTGFPGGFFSVNPFGNPFSGFMQSMEDMMTRLRDQMSQVLHRLPPDNVEWKEIADGKGNTTSTTKVINGHKVTINETTYTNEGDDSGSVFKIRIVDVHPTSEEESEDSEEKVSTKSQVLAVATKDVEETTPKNTKEETTPKNTKEEITPKNTKEEIDTGSPELIEEAANEIPRGKQEIESPFDDVESFGEDMTSDAFPGESVQSIKYSSPEYAESNEVDLAPPVREIESNNVDFEPVDLSNDILVNDMAANSGAPLNPDAEIFTVDEREWTPLVQRPYFEKISSPEIIVSVN